jgi:DNA-directed RNA polymerase specialized sigma24 family protein
MDVDFEQWYRLEHSRLVNSMFVVSGSVDVAAEAPAGGSPGKRLVRRRVSRMESPAGWTYTVAFNVVRRTMRKRDRERRAVGRLMPGAPLEIPIPHPEVWEAIGALPSRQRTAIVLRYVADLPELDIAQILGVPRGTVASDLSRGRAALADRLDGVPDDCEEIRHG